MSDSYDWLFPNTTTLKKISWKKKVYSPVKIEEDLKEAKRNNNLIVSKFETIKDLQKLRDIAKKSLHGQSFPIWYLDRQKTKTYKKDGARAAKEEYASFLLISRVFFSYISSMWEFNVNLLSILTTKSFPYLLFLIFLFTS